MPLCTYKDCPPECTIDELNEILQELRKADEFYKNLYLNDSIHYTKKWWSKKLVKVHRVQIMWFVSGIEFQIIDLRNSPIHEYTELNYGVIDTHVAMGYLMGCLHSIQVSHTQKEIT